ncbi:hypothetical protein HMPREF1015_02989 [Bacillus smithii 7_3_47FAA]|uniref:Uncharacterized protein n=1 Tax=Bacillus smithii 7_3_47FAA TaxID=665952 RepID=G9QIR2_9BACI|nr:hypothetical protein HMPREF1015_02989 [Bacillus smithii 7_3_47FAA]
MWVKLKFLPINHFEIKNITYLIKNVTIIGESFLLIVHFVVSNE